MIRKRSYLKSHRRVLMVALVCLAVTPGAVWGQWTTGSGGTVYYNNGNCQYRLKNPHYSGRKFPSPRQVVVYSFGW